MESIAVIILAAGKGTRMGQDLPKVLTPTNEKMLIEHVLEQAVSLKPEKTVVVTGYKSEMVEKSIQANESLCAAANVEFALQTEQNGTGDAVRAALPALQGFNGTVVVLCGDVPLVKSSTLADLLAEHQESQATVSLVSLRGDTANAYGRVIRNDSGEIIKITELKDCSNAERRIDETNSGIYAVESAFLAPAVESLSNDNAQGEYYLTDIVEKAASEGQTVSAISTYAAAEIQGINTRADLSFVNAELRRERVQALAAKGVHIEDLTSCYIDSTVEVAAGAYLGPNTILKGKTTIAADVVIEGSAYLVDTEVGRGAQVKFNVRAEASSIGANSSIGPFAHLRPNSVIGSDVKIGNFVETKNTKMHDGAKAGHLTYLGDAEVGSNVNIGAGVITANYDGVNKNKTSIGQNTFVGSNSVLIAPITLGEESYVGAGSVLSKEVPSRALAFTRPPLKVKENWKKPKKP